MFRRFVFVLSLLLPCAAQQAGVTYEISLKDAASHYASVQVTVHGGSKGAVQLPVWNALYQVRDFARNVSEMSSSAGPAEIADKTTWKLGSSNPGGAVTWRYRIYLADAGPFGAEVSSEHAFLNFAQVLVYPLGEEHDKQPITVRITDVPTGWRIATPLPIANGLELHAESYDQLVDSPTELGNFNERTFDDSGKHYRVVVHGEVGSYDIERMSRELQRIVHAETEWMQDAPFDTYTFVYQVNASGGGGMEHSHSTAIGLQPLRDERAWRGFESVSAHEFFHLWNVKRIRPASLEPVDYTKEQYARELWFSEGITSTVAEYALVKAGLQTEQQFLEHFAQQVDSFRARPAHLWQSPEESSLDTWFDKYQYYGSPERSVSYYLSGELIGYMLDLQMRQQSGGKASMRNLFQRLNQDFAKEHRYFTDEDLLREIRAVAGMDERQLFAAKIQHAGELDFEQIVPAFGLDLKQVTETVGDAGFGISGAREGTPQVSEVTSDAARSAGLRAGDAVVSVNGEPATRRTQFVLQQAKPGSEIALVVRRGGQEVPIQITTGSKQAKRLHIEEEQGASAKQAALRKGWLAQEDAR